jgi:hypothetical protein
VEITIQTARLNAQDIQIGDLLTLQELRLTAKGISLRTEPGGTGHIAEIDGTVVLTEVAINKMLSGRAEEGLRDIEVETLTGRLRISGRREVALGLAVPFTLTAVPVIEGGTHLRLDASQISVIAGALPGFVTQAIGEKINARLKKAFDTSHLPLPLRLTSVDVEPGRVLLSATASLELRPATTEIQRASG